MKKNNTIVKIVRKITMAKLDKLLAMVGYKRREFNGFGYIINQYGKETNLTTFGHRLEVRDNVFGEDGKGTIYFSLEECNLEYNAEMGHDWKTLSLYGKVNKNIFINIYDDRKV